MARGTLILAKTGVDATSSRATTTSPDLGRAVGLLADGIQSSMRSLYNLQLALINTPNRRGLSAVLEECKRIREFFRTDWENDIVFLQQCYNYADEYLSLCDFAMTLPQVSKTSSLPNDVLIAAKDVYEGVGRVKERHDKLYKELRRHESKLSSLLGTTPRRIEDNIARRRTRILDVPIHQGSLRPSGADSLVESYTSLDQIGTSLGDLTVFWRDHIDYLVSIASKRKTVFPPTISELRMSMEIWKRHQSALLSAMSSISESSDAVTVNPVDISGRRDTRGSAQKPTDPSRTPRIATRIVGLLCSR